MLADANELVAAMKKAATEAVEAGKPVNVFFGKVKAVKPLKIDVEQKLLLGEKQLILSRSVTDYKITITGGNTKDYYYTGSTAESGTAAVSPPHVHAIGKTEITVHNGLAVGDEVLLIRQQEGQKFFVIERIGGAG